MGFVTWPDSLNRYRGVHAGCGGNVSQQTDGSGNPLAPPQCQRYGDEVPPEKIVRPYD